MFLVRSAFWLTVAFLVIKPGVDLERAAQDLSDQALSAGRQVVAEAIAADACTSLTCIGGKAMLSAAIAEPTPRRRAPAAVRITFSSTVAASSDLSAPQARRAEPSHPVQSATAGSRNPSRLNACVDSGGETRETSSRCSRTSRRTSTRPKSSRSNRSGSPKPSMLDELGFGLVDTLSIIVDMNVGPDPRELRTTVYATFASEGRAPSVAELARRCGVDEGVVRNGLRRLDADHALVLARDGDAIRMAHPFTSAPMAFVVTPADGYDDRRWWGGCAWDSFGISAALDIDIRIDTECPECGGVLSVLAGPSAPPPGGLAVWFPTPAARWWDDVVATCARIRLFCNHAHGAAWVARRGGGSGRLVDAAIVWQLAQPWYGDRLRPDYTPHSRETNQSFLDACGLTGAFWSLPK